MAPPATTANPLTQFCASIICNAPATVIGTFHSTDALYDGSLQVYCAADATLLPESRFTPRPDLCPDCTHPLVEHDDGCYHQDRMATGWSVCICPREGR